METTELKNEKSHKLLLSHTNTWEEAVRESGASQRSSFACPCSLHGWMEVRERVSQLTGPSSDWNTGPSHMG